MLDVSLIILAAGDSSRFELPVKKQFLRFKDEPLWLYVSKRLSSFYDFKKVIVTSSNVDYMKKFSNSFVFTQGGKTRSKSLLKALELVESEYVMVSDAARVLVDKDTVLRLIDKIKSCECVSPYISVCDTSLYGDKQLKREDIKLIQTPQLSKTSLLKKSLSSDKEFTDDSSAMAHVGAKIDFIKGDEKARKLTYKQDLKVLDLPPPSLEFFSGSGFDVHEFGEKRDLVLGGVKIPYHTGLKAHSDGDVLAHSLSDALLGAANLGDIGKHFPDTDKAYKDADSMQLLSSAYKLVQEYGFELVNADVTVLAQEPKLFKFKDDISKNIAKYLNVEPFRISIKASTTEGLGFVGRKEGIAVLSSVNLKYFDWTKI